MDEPRSTAQNIVEHAQQISDAAKRRAYLERVCAGNPELRQQVERLLHAPEQDGSCLDQPVSTLNTNAAPSGAWFGVQELLPSFPLEGVGSRIGPYKLLQKLGEGGMGAVFMAEQQQPVRRMVALKVIKAGMDSAQVIARFEAERQALALMDHPNIAKVLDAGTTQSGRPYFVMELVKGIPLTHYCDGQRLTLRQRLELFVPVCQAIQHAHQKGIIHRDIKPSNVLVASYDGKPVPKVIDFGVAKAMGGKLTDHTVFTGFGALIGTLEYMSPEQAEFNALDIDTRSDIYSLGVLLYELLTGTTPLTRQRLKDAAIPEVLRLIREEEPPRPSTRLSESKDSLASVSAQRHLEPAALVKAVRGEVDWIVMKALEKDRSRRYETANALARDIERYLAEEPVEAGPPSTAYRLRKLAWKHRHGLATAAVLILLLLAGTAVSTWQAVRATKAEGRALHAENEARQAEQAAVAERNRALTAETEAKEQRDKALAAEKAAKQSEADAKAVLEFFQTKVLSAGRPKDQEGGLGKEVKLSEAVNAAESAIAKAFADRPLVEAAIRDTLGTTYWFLGDYPPAIQQHERALALRESKLGLDHPQTLEARNNLATTYFSAGRAAEAIHLFEQVLQQFEAKLGRDHPDTLDARNNLAVAYDQAGRTAEAIRMHEQNLKHRESKLGVEHPDTFFSRANLALAYGSAGRTAEAIRLHEQNLKHMEAQLGTEHPDTLACRNNLAMAYQSAGRLHEAIALFAQTLKQLEVRLGTDHPHTLMTRSNLADAYDRDGQFGKAETLYRAALDQTCKRFGAGDVRTAGQMTSLATNLLHQSRYGEAESLLRDSRKILEAKQLDDWATFYVRSLLGGALLGQKKYADAEPLLLSGYQGMQERQSKIPLKNKGRVTKAVERLVQLYEATGKKRDADQWRKELERSQKMNANDVAPK